MLTLILTLALIGFVAYLIITYIPMPAVMKNVIVVIVAICLIIYVMSAFGVVDVPVPHLR